ncbi:MAG: hypothetical protein U9P72_01325 [Campylobacterota bacterium]|nr:hypothetical protein [Campylobacterota bacterium]
MKPLINTKEFLKRFDDFKDGEIRSIELISATKISIILTAQDRARDFDWVSMKLEFNNVVDAKLLDESKLSLINMEDGITIACDDNRFSFAIGKYSNTASIKNSLCYIECLTIKYEEGLF